MSSFVLTLSETDGFEKSEMSWLNVGVLSLC